MVEDNNKMIMETEATFNDESLHIDLTCNFKATSPDIFFGEDGEEEVSVPYLTITPESRKTKLYISTYDFWLFEWSISITMHKWFDECSAYSYNQKQWRQILDEAEKLLNFSTFDDLFDYMEKTIGIDDLNYRGVSFWNNRKKFQEQLDDIREWTKLVLNENEDMKVLGY